jgi:hypothetical protein
MSGWHLVHVEEREGERIVGHVRRGGKAKQASRVTMGKRGLGCTRRRREAAVKRLDEEEEWEVRGYARSWSLGFRV